MQGCGTRASHSGATRREGPRLPTRRARITRLAHSASGPQLSSGCKDRPQAREPGPKPQHQGTTTHPGVAPRARQIGTEIPVYTSTGPARPSSTDGPPGPAGTLSMSTALPCCCGTPPPGPGPGPTGAQWGHHTRSVLTMKHPCNPKSLCRSTAAFQSQFCCRTIRRILNVQVYTRYI